MRFGSECKIDILPNGFKEEPYSLINAETPGIFGLGNTKEESIKEYLSGFHDSILINENKNYF
ncbi:MAG: hypothetical protein Q9M94_01055 [Candidatus Gracilibacteria bacterium]|nr:hypothetical protein [Candidatus Gracilibacteria bacterium]MDQ7022455.1 hypothetical protein [Candidatus Gracilibacteria bacterium]